MRTLGRVQLLAVVACAVLAYACVAFCGDVALPDELVKHTVVVRGYYVGSDLRFDQNGQLTSSAITGFGQSDARLYVDKVESASGRLIIEGTRTFPIYNQKLGKFQLTSTGEKVKIEVALPPGNNDSAAVHQLLAKVLLTAPELENKCTPEEQARFQDLTDFPKDRQKTDRAKKDSDLPEAASLSELPAYCFPTGEKAYCVGHGLKPPRALSTADPAYPEAARHDRIEGTVTLLLIVDQQGRPCTIYVVRSAGSGLDEKAIEAIQKWRFQPATFQGNPVAAAINVQINFKLF